MKYIFNETELTDLKVFMDEMNGLLGSDYVNPKLKDRYNEIYRLCYDKLNGADIKNYWYRRNWDNSVVRFYSLEDAEEAAIKTEMGEVIIHWTNEAVKRVDGEAYYA